MKTANPRTSSPLPRNGSDEGLRTRLFRTVSRIALSALLAAAAPLALAQTFPAQINNTATITPPSGVTNSGASCTGAGRVFNSANGTCSSTDTNTLAASSDLAISKTGTATVNQGGTVTYTIRAWNNGVSSALGATITDTVPANLTSVSWTCAATGAGTTCGTASGTGNSISLSANLGVDTGAATSADTSFVTITVTGTATTPGAITNTANIAVPAGATDPTPGNNSSSANTTITALNDLAISKTGTATVNQNGTVTYTIRVWNNGPAAVTGAAIADTVPANLTSVSWTCAGTGAGSTCSAASGTGNTIALTANLPVDTGAATSADTSFVTVTVTGTATTPGAIANTASVTAPAGSSDPTPGNNSSTANTTITALNDLAISKTGTASVNQGGTVTYTIRVWNNGPSAVTAAAIADTVPANLTSVSWTCAGTGAGSTCSAASGTGNSINLTANLPVDTGAATSADTSFVTITVTGTATTPGSINNTATVAAPAGTSDPTAGNNSSSAATTIAAQADLAIVKGVSNSTPTVGSNVTFTLTVTNNGPSAAAAVSVADLLPNGYTYVSDNGAGAYVPGTGVWTIGSLANGASTSLQIVATVRATGTYANTATVSSTTGDPTPGNNTSTSTPTPVASADLVMAKSVSNATPTVGTNVTFTLTVTNNGPSAATGVSVADLLPNGYTYVSDNGAGAYVSGTGVWTIGNLANGASTSLQIVATVRATGTYANTATVSSTTSDPTPGNNTATSTPTPVASSDLAIVKGVSNSTPTVGTNVTFTLTVTNNGPSAATGVSVADLLPNGYTYVSDNGAGAYVSGTGVWTIGNLANGASTSLQIVATVRATGTYANTATVSSTTNDPTPGNNTSTSTPTPVVSSDVAIVKVASNNTPTVGTNVTFTLTVTNNGPSGATGVSVADLLPNGYTYVSDNGAGAYVPGTGVWTIGNLANGASTSLQIVATVRATGTYANTATVSSTSNDPTPGNNTSTSTPAPVASADLAITKVASNNSPAVGTNVSFTLTVTNNGPSAAAAVSVADLLPSGYTYVSDNGAGAYVPGTGVWTIGSLANGASASLQITATVNAAGSYANTATVSSTTNDPTPGNNTSTSTPTPVVSSDVAIVKVASNNTPTVGTNVTFTLTVTNNGPSAATGVSVADLLPSGYTYVSDNGAGAYVPGTGAWTIGNLANGASASLQITATVNATGGYANTATVSSTSNDPTPGNNTSTSTPAPVASSDLAIVKTASSNTPTVGTNVTFTLTVTNNGPSAATGVSVADLLPNGYTYVSDNGAGAYVPGTGAWTIGNLANGASASLQITATVNATGTYANTATVSSTTNDPTPGNNTSTSTPTPVASADLAIVKTASNNSPTVGTNVTFTLTVTNNGPSAAAAVSVADLLPNGYTYVSDNGAGAYVPGTGAWTIGNLASGASASLQITATVNATGTYANTATVTSTTSDPTPGNNTSTSTPTPVASSDLAIVKTASSNTPTVGTNVTFTLTVTNNGPSAATGVSVADLLPNGYTYVSDNGAGAYVPGTGAWTIGNLANGASTSLQITASVNATGSYANTATVTSTTSDPTPGNNTSTSTPTPVASSDLAITKVASNNSPTVGTNVSFTLTVTNNGPSAATGVSVSDLLPNGYTYVSDDGAGAYVAGTGAWTIGNLANGASVSLQITATVNATGAYANTATVTSTTNDPTPGNNTSTSTPTPVASSDLAIVKTASSNTPTVGTNVTFTLTVTNNGPSAATGVSVADLLPSGYTYVSDNGAGAYVPGTGAWTIGTLANGASASLQITATVNAAGSYANTATVTSTTSDPTPGNNTSTSTPTPVASSDLAIVKTVSNASPNVGDNVVFTLTVTNNGPSDAAGVSVADLLPSGYTYVSDDGAGAYVSGTGAWTIGTLANGASTALQITATVNAAGTYANTATVTSTTSDPTPGNNTSTSTPGPVPTADLAIVKTASNNSPTVGTNVTFTLTVTNNGPSDATSVSVADLLPSGYTYVSDNGAGAYVSGTGAWTIGTLANGASTSLQITATVNATGTYANTATVTSATNDPTPGNNTSTATPGPVASSDLAITKVASSNTPTVGTNVTFTLTVTNNGPSDATGVSVADLLPNGYAYVSDNGAGAYVPGTGAWTIGNLANGASASLQITALVNAAGSYANTATVTSTTSDPTPGNNTSTSTPTPVASADLSIDKDDAGASVVPGNNVVYTLTVANAGPSDAAAVQVSDVIPAGLGFVSAAGTGWTCANNAGTVECSRPTLAAGGNATITLTLSVPSNYGGAPTVSNTATVASTTSDPSGGNNSDTETTPVSISIDAVDDPAAVLPFAGGTVPNVTVNDTTNGVAVVIGTNATAPTIVNNGGLTGLVANPDGSLTVPAGSTPGAYTVTYRICTLPGTTPATCDDASVPVVVGPDAVDDTATTPQNTVLNGTATGGDSAPVGSSYALVTGTSNGTLVLNGDGTYTYTPNANYSGPDSFTYRLCLPAPNGTVCDTATVSITVGANTVTAVDDSANTPQNTAVTVPVIGNDTVTGAPLDPASVTVTVNPANGTVTCAAGQCTYTPNVGFSGNDSFEYRVCDTSTPTPVCDTATVTVTVAPAVIVANDDDYSATPVNGANGSASVGNILGNDSLNGGAVDLAFVTLTVNDPNAGDGVSVAADGTVSVAAGTPAGTYVIPYQLCETARPSNCDTASITVLVAAAPIDAVDDLVATPVNGTTGGTAVTNVLTNDTLNGAAATTTNVTLAPVTNGPLTVNANGTVDVAPNTPAGTYTVTYQICEVLNPSNCDTATVTVTVNAAPIDAVDDLVATPVNGTTGGTGVVNVLTNDTLNGTAVVPGSVTLTPVTNGPLTVNANGTVDVAPNTPAGTYTVTYQICEVLNPSNCDTAVVTVTVNAAPIDAVDDLVATPVNGTTGGTAVTNVLGNDTLNGAAATTTNVTLAPVTNGPLTVNANGTVDVAPNTPAGTYTVTYQICEVLNPSNCDTATVTVTVNAAPIDAVDDLVATPVNGTNGGTAVTNVLGNDTLNGSAATTTNVTLTPVTNGPLTVNANGTVDVAPNTPAGTYTATYQICEVLNPSNCDTAVVTVTVNAAPIDAVDDLVATPVNGTTGGTGVVNVLTNDTLNGTAVVPGSVTLTPVTNGPLTVNANGTVDVAPNTPAGTYTVTYQICEVLNPTNCDTATVTVTVSAAPIDAVDDVVGTPVNGTTGGTAVVNVLGNDTLNGSAATTTNVTLTPVTNGPLTVNANGTVDVAPNTPAGTYTATYQICEVLNPSNCDTAVVTVTVVAPAITATDDSAGGSGVTPQNTPVTTNVLTNDTLNGVAVDPALVNVTIAGNPAHGTVVVNPNGTITYTPSNNYSGPDSYTYTICEKLNPTNCATAMVTVTVQPNTVVANDDTAATNQQVPVAITVVGNDTATGAPLDPASVTVTVPPANGTVSCAAGVCTYTPNQFFAGTDTFTYRVCDTSTPTPVCDTAVVTITVNANAPVLRLTKVSATRSVKVGDLVRYTVTAENVGDSPARNASLVDTPPAGFTYVDGSLTVSDDDNAGSVGGTSPLRINGIDVGIGRRATIVYFLRVGAGVGNGVHTNSVSALDVNGTSISNVATADVDMAGDPLLEDSLILGSVFDDRDGDGWQDPAKASEVRVQGGFAPGAYVAGSTTVDRGQGPQPEADASAPLLHGIALGDLGGRSSTAAPVSQVVVRQTLRSPDFSDDFVLTTGEGTTLRMNAAGQTTVERGRGDAAKGLTGQDLQVSRQVSQTAAGYEVTYTIRNEGVDERGIPGVRIASVEGLIMETDAYGRYHLEGIHGGDIGRGRNFILKVDPATLPPGSVFTTENPRVRRVTQGVPVRFDFGVKLPAGEIRGGRSETDVELGEVMFEAGSDQVKDDYAPLFGKIAQRLREADGGSVTIAAQAEAEALAFARARAVQAALSQQLDPELAKKVRIDVVAGSDATLVSLDQAIKLGELLFDTDQATIRPQYRELIAQIAQTLNREGRGTIGIVGRADPRGASDYNVKLGLRRAKAVLEAISAQLDPQVRQNVRVDITDDTNAPVGVGGR
ncbi:CARDB domain-containing protein [Lysobacter silvisoli]|uniref:DUF11 domain-containing protein n=1 Tax=Lysobacter silvisoli TaxID=2293254 RepID=A0A371K629_9GAMM|nr:CARDB domain-containing protein [Lysobacter silvisoli]RDZ29314.1 DUF11 domain-containing protein [Lysobacter silvisoli]